MSYQLFYFIFNSFLQDLKGSHEHGSHQPFYDRWYQNAIQTEKKTLLDCVIVYNILLPSGEKLLKCKTVHKINGLIGNIQYFSGTEPSTCQNVFQTVYFSALLLTRHAIQFLCLKSFTLRVADLKASLALIHMTTF